MSAGRKPAAAGILRAGPTDAGEAGVSNARKITDDGPPTSAPAPAQAAEKRPADDGLVEVMLTGHYTLDGVPHLPGDPVRVTPELAASLRFSGYAARE